MKYQPKEGDFVNCSSIKEKVELLELARDNGYEIYEPSLIMNSKYLIYSSRNNWVGTDCKEHKRTLTPKMFKSLISGVKYEFEENDAVEAPFGELCKIHSLLTENGYHTYSSLTEFKSGKEWAFLYYDYSNAFVGSITRYNVIPTDLFIELITCSKQEKQMENSNEKIIIPAQLLRDGYAAAKEDQKIFIRNQCNALTGETTKGELRILYNMINKGCAWRSTLEREFPFLKEPEPIVIKYGEKVDGHDLFGDRDSLALIRPRVFGRFAGESFCLCSDYNWEIKKDEIGISCLIITRKS